jgi:hypothetical protein
MSSSSSLRKNKSPGPYSYSYSSYNIYRVPSWQEGIYYYGKEDISSLLRLPLPLIYTFNNFLKEEEHLVFFFFKGRNIGVIVWSLEFIAHSKEWSDNFSWVVSQACHLRWELAFTLWIRQVTASKQGSRPAKLTLWSLNISFCYILQQT